MLQEIRNIRASKNDLRRFGVILALALAAVVAIVWWRSDRFWAWLLAVSVILAVTGLLIPAVLRPLHRLWMAMAILLGWLTTRILLTAVFFLILTPIGLLASVAGRDPLRRRGVGDVTTYWIKRPRSAKTLTSYDRQF